MPLPVGLVYDAAGHVILDPDTAVRGAVAHLLATFEATGSATACVKAFSAAGLLFPWPELKDDMLRSAFSWLSWKSGPGLARGPRQHRHTMFGVGRPIGLGA
jgi:hypothetical protein